MRTMQRKGRGLNSYLVRVDNRTKLAPTPRTREVSHSIRRQAGGDYVVADPFGRIVATCDTFDDAKSYIESLPTS